MSYILDALKKAEADRDPDTRARLAFEVREQRRNRFITYAVLAALIANAAVLLWVFLPDELPAVAAPEPVGSAPAMEPARTAAEPALPAPPTTPEARSDAPRPEVAAHAPVPEPESPAPRASPAEPDGSQVELRIDPQTAAAGTAPAALSSLPEAVRRRLPPLSFSTHIYADDAELRAVVVNGRRLVEGDRLGELTLERITEEGAVFLFEGRLVEVGVLDDWN